MSEENKFEIRKWGRPLSTSTIKCIFMPCEGFTVSNGLSPPTKTSDKGYPRRKCRVCKKTFTIKS
jgi:hypothetical protein